MTDVNITVHMLTDAIDNKYDMALLVSGDSDLTPPVEIVQRKFGKRVIVVFPPDRFTVSLKNKATSNFILGRQKIFQSQFPLIITTSQGHTITKPPEWQ